MWIEFKLTDDVDDDMIRAAMSAPPMEVVAGMEVWTQPAN